MMSQSLLDELKQIIEREEHLYILGRPLWGIHFIDPLKLAEHRDKILALAEELEREGGGVIILSHDQASEKSTLLLLLRLLSALKQQKKQVRFLRPLTLPFLGLERVDGQPPFLLLLYAPQFPDLQEFLEEGWRGRVIFASGEEREWQEIMFRLSMPYRVYPLTQAEPESSRFTKDEKEAVSLEQEKYQKTTEDIREAYFMTVLFDALANPIPLSLLSRSLDLSPEQAEAVIDQAKGLIYWIKREKPPAFLVSTKGPAIAEAFLSAVPDKELIINGYLKAINKANSGDTDERYAIIYLFKALIERGRHRWAKELIQKAEDKITELYTAGSSPEILRWGKIFHQLLLFEHSQKAFQKGLEREPNNHYLLHAFTYMLGDWAVRKREACYQARQLFHQAKRLTPQNALVLHAEADMERKLKNYNEGRELFDQASSIEPGNLYFLVSRAALEMDAKNYAEAERLLLSVLKREPNYLYLNHLLGVVKSHSLNYTEAEEYFRRVLRLNPQSVETLNALGVMYRDRGHWKLAEQQFEKALKIKPDNIHTIHALGKLRAEMGRYEEAEEFFHRVCELDKDNVESYIELAAIRAKQNQIPEAEEYCRKAASIQSENPFIYTTWAEILMSQPGRGEEVRRLIETALGYGGGIPTENVRAKFLAAQGDLPSARRRFEQTLEYAQGLERIITLNTWARVEAEAKDFSRARRCVEQARERRLDLLNSYTLMTWAFVLELQGKNDEAKNYKAEALKLRESTTL